MKIVRYEREDGAGAEIGILRSDGSIAPTGFADVREVIASGTLPIDGGEPGIVGARLLAPLERPGKILCAGVNYESHKDENPNAVIPSTPFFFSKLPTAVIGPDEPIVLPSITSQVDYEVELAVIVGCRAKDLTEEEALDAVFGYTVANDVSGRDVQFVDNQITLGKGFDTFCPLGPAIVTREDVADPQCLRVACMVNGELRQEEGTDNMVFTVAQLLRTASEHITLEPGDVVTTGTPSGVGLFRHPPTFLAPGDVVSVSVDVIGTLSNPVIAGW